MAAGSSGKCLIFTDLPFDIEQHILGFYVELRSNAWHDAIRMFSVRRLTRELYRQAQDQDHRQLSFGGSKPRAYQREIFRLYKLYLDDFAHAGDARVSFSGTEGHAMINLGFMLNDSIDDRIIRLDYAGPADVLRVLDDHMPFRGEAANDAFDKALVHCWTASGVGKKKDVIKRYFDAIKDDCLKNYGIVNAAAAEVNVRESAYRVLRFAFINEPERFK